MKKYLVAFIAGKLLLIAVFTALVASSCQTASLSALEPTPTPPTAANSNQSVENIDRPVSEPYTGDLQIFEDAKRADNLQITRVMDILNIKTDKRVADIGAGSGWFTVRAAERVGAKGAVFAVEINQDYINYINDRAAKANLTNIKTVLGTEDDPKLAADSVDAVMILKTYHEIGQPIKVLTNLKRAMRKDALLGVIDRNGKGDDHGIDKQQVIDEAKRAGFTLKEEFDFTKADGMDYFLVFQKTK